MFLRRNTGAGQYLKHFCQCGISICPNVSGWNVVLANQYCVWEWSSDVNRYSILRRPPQFK